MTIVVFDLDDTLYEEKAPKVAAECAVAVLLADRIEVSHGEALAEFLASKRRLLKDRDLGTARNDRRLWAADALVARGIDDDAFADELVEAYWSTLLDHARPYADALIALPLPADRFELWIATNEHELDQRRKLDRLGLADYFLGVVSADQVGHEKPSAEFFAHLTEALRAEPDAVVVVGDNPHTDIVGACRAGLRCIHFRRGAYAKFDTRSVAGCVPTWTVDYLTEIAPLLTSRTS